MQGSNKDPENLACLLVPNGTKPLQLSDSLRVGHIGKDGTGNDHRPEGVHCKKTYIRPVGVVETDEFYIVCGHKGQPDKVRAVTTSKLAHSYDYNIYGRLQEWGFDHKSVGHSNGEYARDEDGDEF